MSTRSQAALKELTPRAITTSDFKTTVIAVADVGSSPASWSDGSKCWLHSLLPTMIDKPLVLQFQDPLLMSVDKSFSWQVLYESGDVLVECLLKHAENPDFQQRPLVFICHSLGGLVVKRAIGVIYEQYHNPIFDRLIRIFTAIVFLGCPHPTFDEAQRWEKVPLILRANPSLPKGAADQASKNVAAIANISKAFDESNHDIEIISAFESRPTRVGRALLKRHLLVEEAFAMTNSKRETMVRVDAQHGGLCNLMAGSPFQVDLSRLLAIVKTFVSSTHPQMVPIAGPQSLPSWSVSEPDDVRLAVSLSVPSNLSNINAQTSSSDRSAYEVIPIQPIKGIEKLMKLPCFMMSPHPPLPEFCGRAPVLQEVESALSPINHSNSGPLRTFAICGAGGLGKTQIAIQYAFSNKQRKIFDAIFWVPASDENKLANTYSNISVKLGLEDAAITGDQAVSRDLVLEWLSNPARKVLEGGKLPPDTKMPAPHWLLVFDGADNVGLLRDYWPVGGKGSILITSRDPLAKTQSYVQSNAGIILDPFSVEEAATFLKSLTGFSNGKDNETAYAIVKRLSCFPLAVAQIARTISRRGMSLKEFLAFYDQDSIRHEMNKVSINSFSDREEQQKTVATIWSLEDLSPSAAAVFNLISFMDPDQISESLLTNTMRKSNKTIYIEDYPKSLDAFTIARGELLASSLSQRNIDDHILTTHSVIQDTNRLRMTTENFERAFQFAAEILYDEWPFSEFDHNTRRWPACETLISHITTLEQIYSAAVSLHHPLEASAEFARLLMDVGWYHVERGRFDQAPTFINHAETVCKLVPTSTMITLADIMYCRADIAQMNRNPHAALPLAIEYNSLAAKHDPGGWRLPQSHNTLAAVYLGTGDFAAAIRHADLAITGYSSLPEPDFVDWSWINKAWGQFFLGQHDEAVAGLKEYLRQRSEGKGPFGPLEEEPYKTATAKTVLGQVYREQRKYEDSVAMLKEALQQLVQTVGEKHDDVASTHAILADTYRAMGENSLARDEYTTSLSLRTERTEDLAEICYTYFKLSRSCLALKDAVGVKNARDHAERILAMLGDNLTEDGLRDLLPAWSR